MDAPNTLLEAVKYFADVDRCHAFMIDLRWPDGQVRCPRCDSARVSYLANANVWKCYEGHKQAKFSLKVGTIFEDSPLGLDKWLVAVWLVVNCKNGISSYEMHRALGITQKSAWFMNHRIRLALQDGSFSKLSGEVEVDETFIGGKARNMHVAQRRRRITGTGGKDKTAVLGILERGGNLDEQTFRFNNRRDASDFDRFKLAASQVVGKRLTYAELSGKTHDTSAH